MGVTLRANAAFSEVREGTLRGGGSGRGAGPTTPGVLRPRLRYSQDPASELMPAAAFLGHATDYDAILEQFVDGPFDPSKRRVLGRLMGMFAMDYQGARHEERRFLRRLLAEPHAKEAYAANRALHLLQTPAAVRRTLALCVAFGLLGAVQARMAATTLRLLGPKSRRRVGEALVACGHGSTACIARRGLVLKAVAARRHRLAPWSTSGAAALSELVDFSGLVSEAELAELSERSHLHGAAAADVARAAIDPVFAWYRGGPLQVTESPVPNEVEDTLPELPELEDSPLYYRTRLHWALAVARSHPSLMSPQAAQAIAAYIAGSDMSERRLRNKDEALAAFLERGFDVVEPQALELMRQDAQGVYRFDAARALGDLLSRFTGAAYWRRQASDQMTAGADPAGQLEAALERGMAIPLAVGQLRSHLVRGYGVVATGSEAERVVVFEPLQSSYMQLRAGTLFEQKLPEAFGSRARLEAYWAPAALDLLAPPFGVVMEDLGIRDEL